ncbi:hypothetical protein CBL_00910 [Carabus blaptoides fortunei]
MAARNTRTPTTRGVLPLSVVPTPPSADWDALRDTLHPFCASPHDPKSRQPKPGGTAPSAEVVTEEETPGVNVVKTAGNKHKPVCPAICKNETARINLRRPDFHSGA